MNAKDANPIPLIEARKVQRSRDESNRLTYSGISFLAVAPPVWASIPSDALPRPNVDSSHRPAIISLTRTSSCNCLSPRHNYDPSAPSITQKCTVYDLLMHWETDIQLQRCPACNFTRIGPDCGDLGIFNYNNGILVTHSLLNDYINAYTASETPFAAWITVISRRYATLSKPQVFLDPKIFRNIWFAYAELIQFGNDMICPQCGPNPSAVIWDGVSISFNQKMALPSLRPPTIIHPKSLVYDRTVRVKETQCIPDRGLRKRIREIIIGPSLAGGMEPDKGGEDSGSGSDGEELRGVRAEALAKKKEGLKKRFQLIPKVVEDLSELDDALGGLFQQYFGMEAVLKHIDVPHEYRDLYIQIAAEENALQMMNARALVLLKQFILSPSYLTGFNTTCAFFQTP
ncbi:hypothetical protein HYPSUDRAFT_209938 [Hypholoma sublateritium FD-334 SS-4]|uniref:HMG domain-containing protein n=1 Tax=Hypholoma sublateritium (strain FD-334 SS-4) TaxID=945553 RepID=A0A0D2NWP8_HYPSF|nr:hypothetical protein HYPSUDRAFT_209938 [Hypholoma sublateritium FD-334 SS-4]